MSSESPEPRTNGGNIHTISASETLTQNGTTSQQSLAADSRFFPSSGSASPATARRTLETHIADTDRRIRDASKLGTNLLEQKRLLTDRLSEVDQLKDESEIDPELRQKLEEVQREYNELGKESSRLSMTKIRKMGTSIDAGDGSVISGEAFASPSKPSALTAGSSRKQRNTSSRVEDLAFATEISTSLLGQVRQLQNTLAEKEEALRKLHSEHSSLQTDSEHVHLRLKSVLDNEQRYKDENWHLETQVQELSSQVKETVMREQKANQHLVIIQREKSVTERDLDELRLSHGKLNEDHSTLLKKHENEVANLRRNVASTGSDRDNLQRKIGELSSQNEELARAVAVLMNEEHNPQPPGTFLNDDDDENDEKVLDPSPPGSPVKGTPRHGVLETETLKSSLHHAHRMIQNLKNNIHREKTEKLELRRMLQDARDEVETHRAERGIGAGKKKKQVPLDSFKKPARPDKLGSRVGASEEIINDPSWEEYDDSPTKQPAARRVVPGDISTDASDAFETASENEPATESDAFETAASVAGDDSEGDATETETTQSSRKRPSALKNAPAGNRTSFLSTASSDEESYDLVTPPRNNSVRQPGRMPSRGGMRGAAGVSSFRDSPASFVSNSSQATPKQDLAAELEGFDNGSPSVASSTPSRTIYSNQSSPEDMRKRETQILVSPRLPRMVDSGTLTDPWEPVSASAKEKHAEIAAAGGVVTGAGIGAALGSMFSAVTGRSQAQPERESSEDGGVGTTPHEQDAPQIPDFAFSPLASQHTSPVAPMRDLNFSSVSPQSTAVPGAQEPVASPHEAAAVPNLAQPSQLSFSGISSTHTVPLRPRSAVKASPRLAPSRSFQLDGQARSASPLASLNGIRSQPSTNATDKRVADAPHITTNQFEDVFIDKEGIGRAISNSPSENENFAREYPSAEQGKRTPFQQVSGNGSPRKLSTTDRDDRTTTMQPTQTVDSAPTSRDKGKGLAGILGALPPTQQQNSTSPRAKQFSGSSPPPALGPRSPNRPGSASSMRNRATSPSPADMPPLPADHREVIAAASRTSSLAGNITPPIFPQPTNKGLSQKTSGTLVRGTSPSRVGTTGTPAILRPVNRPPSVTVSSSRPPSSAMNHRGPDAASTGRRSSISSFASEIDDRFHRQAYPTYHAGGFDITSSTDPRMIQAITQTMIGEFMWKYTRKPGRGSSHSDNRHKRFFWIHPYTRTLYWSVHDPARSTHGQGGVRPELKAKSVPIEAVRVLSDENPHPPGLCNKSIVVVTPSRSIKFTAPTSIRHETWFNALSYLLLRNSTNDRANDASDQVAQYSSVRSTAGHQVGGSLSSMRTSTTAVNSTHHHNDSTNTYQDRSTALNTLTSEDISEFNPTLHPRPGSRTGGQNPSSYRSGRSNSSMGVRASASFGNRANAVTPSPSKSSAPQSFSGSLAARQAAAVDSSGVSNSAGTTPIRGHYRMLSTQMEGNSAQSSRPTTAVQTPSSATRTGDVDAEGFRKPAIPVRHSQQRSESVGGSLTSRVGGLFRSKSHTRVRTSDIGPPLQASSSTFGADAGSLALGSGNGSPAYGSGAGSSALASQETLENEPYNQAGPSTVENVRACCDGKHDVGHLSHTHSHRHKSLSLGGRNSTHLA